MVLETLSLLWRRFSPLEERLLAAARKALPPPAVSIFDAQVAAVNHVQRLPPSWSEIDFYRRPSWNGVPMFPNTDESLLVEVRFRAAGRQYKSELSIIAGHIFDFTTLPGPKAAAFLPWDEAPAVVLRGDPLRPPTGRKQPEHVPERWKLVLAKYRGCGPNGWVLYDEATAYRVVCGDAQYLILAEGEGPQFILHRIEPPGERLYWLEHHDDTPVLLECEPEAIV